MMVAAKHPADVIGGDGTAIQGTLFGDAPEVRPFQPVTLKSIAERYGVEYSPVWLSDVCRVTPRQYRNHTACDRALCTCGCHKQKMAAVMAGEDQQL